MQMLLQEISEVETPGYIYCDNEAYIFWAKILILKLNKTH